MLSVEFVDSEHTFDFEFESTYMSHHLLNFSSFRVEKSKTSSSTSSVILVPLIFREVRAGSLFKCRTPSLNMGFDSSSFYDYRASRW